MLDLAAPTRRVEGVELAGDDRDPLRFHALPPEPKVAVHDGVPSLQLLRFVDGGALTGGHLRLQTQIAHPAGMLDHAAAALGAELRTPVSITPVAVTSTAAELLFIGRESNEQGGLTGLLARPYSAETAMVQPPHVASFAIPLTAAGVGLIEATLRSGAAPIAAVQRIVVEGLWPAQRVVARVDWSRVYEHISAEFKSGDLLSVDDVSSLTERLVEERAIIIDAVQALVPEPGAPPLDIGPALAFVQREIVERFCEPVMELSREPAHASLGTLGEIFAVGTQFAAKHLTQIERASGELDLQLARVVTRTYTVQSHLADLLAGIDPSGLIVDAGADHPFFKRFEMRVRAAVPLEDFHLQEVVVQVDYGSAQMTMRLTPDAPEAGADSWADASPDGRWTLSARPTFAADAPVDPGTTVALAPFDGSAREVTLDLEELLGLARVELTMAPDERVLATIATVEHRRGDQLLERHEAQLTAQRPSALIWLRDRRREDAVALLVRHLLADQRLVAGAALAVDTRVMRVPPAFPGSMTVQFFAGDDWSDIARIVVALQKVGSDAVGTVTLQTPGSAIAVSLDLPDPANRRYRYRTSRTSKSGTVNDDPWVETDVPVVLLGGVSGDRMIVEITPIGPELPLAGIVLIEVALSYVDAEHQLRDQQVKVIRAVSERPRWEFKLADPTRRTYEYRVTVHRTSGGTSVGPWTKSSDRILPIPITAA